METRPTLKPTSADNPFKNFVMGGEDEAGSEGGIKSDFL